MPLSTDLPTTTPDGHAEHTAGHNATNARVNEVAAAGNAHEAGTTSVHGIADTAALATTSYVDTADSALTTRVTALEAQTGRSARLWRQTAGVSESAGGLIVWNLDQVSYNQSLDVDTNPGTITIPAGAAGLYIATATLHFDAGSAGNRSIIILVNGNEVGSNGFSTASGDLRMAITVPLQLVVADIVSLESYADGPSGDQTMKSNFVGDTSLAIARIS